MAEIEFAARRAGSSLLTVPGAVVIATMLFALAYAEGFLRRLRRRRRAIGAVLGLAAVGAVFGACLALSAWAFTGTRLSVATLVVCAAGGAASGVAIAIAAIRYGRRRRAKRLADLRRPQPAPGRPLGRQP